MVNKIIVIDFGSQYNQLIVRRVRDLGVYSELRSYKISAQEIKNEKNIVGIILSGSPKSVYDEDAYLLDPEIFQLGIPIFGICYGMQLMAQQSGGEVGTDDTREFGLSALKISNECPLTQNIPDSSNVWMSHGDKIKKLPQGFVSYASSDNSPIVIMGNEEKKQYGIQFHTEVRNTDHGIEIIKNFVFKICRAQKNWSMQNFIDREIASIRKKVGKEKVLCALSGGVDSSVVAALLNRAIGKQLTCMFVDHGLLRQNEANQVTHLFKNKLNINFIKIDASQRFLEHLKDVEDPETKRIIIGNQFIRIFEEESQKLADFKWLAQGTLYTDIVESGTETAHKIKSHHNVGGLPKNINFKLIEPLKVLFKDEVRELAKVLGLPKQIIHRQPFPGPGLAIRIIGKITKEKINIVQKSDYILREEIKKANLEDKLWQYFTVLTNLKSVGVMGDKRTYNYLLAIRAITSIDGMSADFAHLPWNLLRRLSVRFVNEIEGINRVVYDCTSKPPATIEWE